MKKEEVEHVIEMEHLKDVVNNILNINIMMKSRKRNIVDTRMIYSKILRERGHTVASIGHSLNRDHTTVLYYLEHFETLSRYDSIFLEKYTLCRDIFIKSRPNTNSAYSAIELEVKISNLTEDNKKFLAERDRVLEKDNRYRRIKKIIDLVDVRTPKGKEDEILVKISQMFNTLFYDKE
jgi:hypothetical protein